MDMIMTAAPVQIADATLEAMRQAMRNTAAGWSDIAQRFLDEQRQGMLQREPTAKDMANQRQRLTWMFRLMRPLYASVSDPDYPDPWPASELHARLIQLEHSWRMFQDPMDPKEADQLLKKIFPE